MPSCHAGRRAALRLLGAGAGIGLGFGAPAIRPARAAAWPAEQPVTVIVPFPPAGGVDVMARVVVQHVAPHLPGARFVVENRVGAGGQLGFEAAFRAAPDGYTLGCVTTPALSTIALERRVQYRVPDFTYIANVVDDPGGFFVPPESPIRSLGELQAAAKRAPEALAYGTSGVGSDDHLLGIAFEEAAGVRLAHIPYNGTAPIITDLLGGRLAFGSFNMSEASALLREGKVRALAQGGAERWSGTPDVPTFREQGFAVTGGSARGVVAPPGLPDAIRERLVEAFGAAMRSPGFLADAQRLNLPAAPRLGADYRAFILSGDEAARALWGRRPWRE
ncbi:tripartite tricarboxylate transporter substrate binding protein [Roseomonas sp. NAR14]|uniref:Tripartite tricarboxylate transporter substrate binding protein n=1 Tax=Roseomonas acroporae TaxID=2937791 RepID=A0A9X1Y9B7_9PROT|nr:tripartite tricarboxylate transporter substrate binding protein [Roseomonas acroporae]MCK8784517.1 tripartite tricarboxylate transporter substrate binding protein [Roseomonas acroporae]